MGKTKGSETLSDALVIFGVTGDLVHKMIFPVLYAMTKRGALSVPVIGVASSEWSLAQLHQRAVDGLQKSGGIDDQHALEHLLSLLRYVEGDYNDRDTFMAIRKLWVVLSAQRITSPSHPRSSRRSSKGSAPQVWPTVRASSSKSRSDAT